MMIVMNDKTGRTNRRSIMGKYRSRLLFLVTIGIMSIFISVPVAGAGICTGADPYTCFTTPSGFVFRTANVINPPNGIQCADQNGTLRTVKNFPERITDGWTGVPGSGVDSYLWCYQLDHDPSISTSKSVNAINLQVALPYFTTQPTPNIKMQSSGKIYQFNSINGCLGDTTTGFEVGDLEACGLKVEYQTAIKSTASGTRFSFATKAVDPLNDLGVGPVIIAPKIGTALEPGFINGPDGSAAFSAAGLSAATCQEINGFNLRFEKSGDGCTKDVYLCHPDNRGCSLDGTFLSNDPPPDLYPPPVYSPICYKMPKQTVKMVLKNIYNGNFITPVDPNTSPPVPIPQFLKMIGFVGGRNDCGEGVFTGLGSCTITVCQGNTCSSKTQNIADCDPAVSNCANKCALPSAPTSLIASGWTSTSVTLRWIDNSTTEDGFKISRAPSDVNGNAGTFTDIGTVTNPSGTGSSTGTGSRLVNFTDTSSAISGQRYLCYKVRGYLSGGGLNAGLGASAVLCFDKSF